MHYTKNTLRRSVGGYHPYYHTKTHICLRLLNYATYIRQTGQWLLPGLKLAHNILEFTLAYMAYVQKIRNFRWYTLLCYVEICIVQRWLRSLSIVAPEKSSKILLLVFWDYLGKSLLQPITKFSFENLSDFLLNKLVSFTSSIRLRCTERG